jgi:hypothetical protein
LSPVSYATGTPAPTKCSSRSAWTWTFASSQFLGFRAAGGRNGSVETSSRPSRRTGSVPPKSCSVQRPLSKRSSVVARQYTPACSSAAIERTVVGFLGKRMPL